MSLAPANIFSHTVGEKINYLFANVMIKIILYGNNELEP